jgi:hypothetical protein
MPLKETLARVDADLAAGRVPAARQRLRGLVSSFPYDLTLRRRLAEVYRLYGDAAEAGRWMYLEEDRNADETIAFEARYGSPAWRMKALAWHGPEAMAATSFAEEQLDAVRTTCAEELGRPRLLPGRPGGQVRGGAIRAVDARRCAGGRRLPGGGPSRSSRSG